MPSPTYPDKYPMECHQLVEVMYNEELEQIKLEFPSRAQAQHFRTRMHGLYHAYLRDSAFVLKDKSKTDEIKQQVIQWNDSRRRALGSYTIRLVFDGVWTLVCDRDGSSPESKQLLEQLATYRTGRDKDREFQDMLKDLEQNLHKQQEGFAERWLSNLPTTETASRDEAELEQEHQEFVKQLMPDLSDLLDKSSNGTRAEDFTSETAQITPRNPPASADLQAAAEARLKEMMGEPLSTKLSKAKNSS